ncbi:BBT_HP_G0108980.mRNA.1.CDS.1 [Saccharomyces cerevisiae]|nr:BBT_HP_G0108980.mRNA.1.CDS.1 [Saccharomyces cerevisiae]CAI6948858.1 BBT_HP_G0108980.mRNA.1.CDS.1 [Saccharomyces cerevisiae]
MEWLESKSESELLEDKEYKEKNDTLQKLGAKSRKEQLDKFEVKQKKRAGGTKRKKATAEPSDNDILSQMTKKRKTKKE